jgi:hypothetical protein
MIERIQFSVNIVLIRKRTMSMHRVEYELKLLEGGTISIDLDKSLDVGEKEDLIIAEIKEIYDGDEFDGIEIISVKELD